MSANGDPPTDTGDDAPDGEKKEDDDGKTIDEKSILDGDEPAPSGEDGEKRDSKNATFKDDPLFGDGSTVPTSAEGGPKGQNQPVETQRQSGVAFDGLGSEGESEGEGEDEEEEETAAKDEKKKSITEPVGLAEKTPAKLDFTKEAQVQKPVRRPKKMFQNSYRLEPNVPYSRDRVQKIMEATMDDMMKGVYYQSENAGDLAVRIAEKLRLRVLALKFDRYKIIVLTNIGPLNRQGIHIGFRCLCDQERDTYNIYTAKSTHAFCTAVIYAIYFE